MSSAFYETTGRMKGTARELADMTEVIKGYAQGVKDVYFMNISFTPESGEEIAFSADGPYGKYDSLKDVPVFREMADAAPAAFFEAEVSGNTDFTEDVLKYRLSGGLLGMETETVNSEDQDEAYLDYLAEQMPYDRFVSLFKIDESSLDEGDYRDLLNDLVIDSDEEESPFDTDYESFVEKLEDYGGETELDEEGFEAVKAEVSEEDILSAYDFREENGCAERESHVYNPVTGEWME